MASVCPRCNRPVVVSAGLPIVSATGAVEVWHPSCWAVRVPRAPSPVTLVAPRSRSLAALAKFVACAVLAIALGEQAWLDHHVSAASLAAANIDDDDEVPLHEVVTAREDRAVAPDEPETLVAAAYPIPLDGERPLDVAYPSLHDWTHPVSGATELMPTQPSRLFGADRPSLPTIRPECGMGHCGVDLDGPRGRPVVAVADGTVVRLELHELGLDGRSGRFVKIEHDDGTLTAYMHLDEIAELAVGDRVTAGQVLGTLGATAVFTAPPHLHFSLEVPNHSGRHGDNTDTHYVDPAPFLVRATVEPQPSRATMMHLL